MDRPEVVLSAAVMTHPRRRDSAEALRAKHPDLDLAIVVDPEPDGPPNALRTARLAWRAVTDDATHHLVVQDDMDLVAGIGDRVRSAAAAMPGHILCFFIEWGARTANAVRLATFEGASWVPLIDPYVPTTAVLMPADVARDLAKAGDTGPDPDDVVLLRYAEEHGLTPHVSVPNLAEHVASPSLVGNDVIMGRRVSVLYAGRLAQPSPPLDGTVSRQTVVPHLLMFDGFATCHLREGAGWRSVYTHEYLARYGVTMRDLLAWFAAAIARTDPGGRLRAVVAEPLLLQVWLTALAYGVCAHDLVPDRPAFDRALAGPLVREALRTFAPGMLKRFVPSGMAPPELVDPLLRAALEQGFTLVAATG